MSEFVTFLLNLYTSPTSYAFIAILANLGFYSIALILFLEGFRDRWGTQTVMGPKHAADT